MVKKSDIEIENLKAKQKTKESLNSVTGYMDTGNPTQVNGKARSMRKK